MSAATLQWKKGHNNDVLLFAVIPLDNNKGSKWQLLGVVFVGEEETTIDTVMGETPPPEDGKFLWRNLLAEDNGGVYYYSSKTLEDAKRDLLIDLYREQMSVRKRACRMLDVLDNDAESLCDLWERMGLEGDPTGNREKKDE